MDVALFRTSTRPLACLKSSLRQCRQQRGFKEIRVNPSMKDVPPFMTKAPPKREQPRQLLEPPSTVRKQIPVYPSPPRTKIPCKEPLIHLNTHFLSVLDPSGSRARLLSKTNPERLRVGDVLLVKFKTGDPVSGTCINIRRGHSAAKDSLGQDTAILLRNTLTRVGLEMWVKVFSPNVTGVELVKRATRKPRRARLYYMRGQKHDPGSVEGVVAAYQRRKAGLVESGGGAKKGKKDRRGRKH